MRFDENEFGAVVIGAGHAGIESALALSRMGEKTLLLTLNLESIGLMACNPAIGGTSKGHLVREIDALGGEMGLAADSALIQMRMLNTGKGPAVHSMRAQMDKRCYHERMKLTLETAPNLSILQGECARIIERNGKIAGIETSYGAFISCRAVVVCAGVYLNSRILIGNWQQQCGPSGFMRAEALAGSLIELGFEIRRFKTGTPARINGATLDYNEMQEQRGDIPMPAFSFLTDTSCEAWNERAQHQSLCHLTYTNAKTHEIIMANLNRSPMYSGIIKGTGARYCPSIEDKIVRFADKERHQIFIEPEGRTTNEMYVQGMNTSMPHDVQIAMLRSMKGLHNAKVLRPGYAIEYDCINPTNLTPYLGAKHIEGLYFAGQVNGTSGYEEAAAQGLYAAINAGMYLKGDEPFMLLRSDAYIGVLVDDLTIKGVDEPYRMMTSRAEYRLLLRQDNADIRLTEIGRRTGLIGEARYGMLMRKQEGIAKANERLNRIVPPDERLNAFLLEKGEPMVKSGVSLTSLLKRSSIRYTDLIRLYDLPELEEDIHEQVDIAARYDGYIEKQREQVRRMNSLDLAVLPDDAPYLNINGLRMEARQKLSKLRPMNIGQASRIPGVTPADIAVLLVWKKASEGGR